MVILSASRESPKAHPLIVPRYLQTLQCQFIESSLHSKINADYISTNTTLSAITSMSSTLPLPSLSSGGGSDRSSDRSYSKPDHIEDARQYYDFLRHRRSIKFYCHPSRGIFQPDEVEPFSLVLSSKHSYEQVSAKVADKLQVDPTHLRFWSINTSSGNPKTAVKRGPNQTLQGMLNPSYSTFSNNSQRTDALYFEVLEMSLAELETRKPLRVSWVSEGITKEVRIITIFICVACSQ
jgi:ubiquitin carboxyl-terminal hydrolase 7